MRYPKSPCISDADSINKASADAESGISGSCSSREALLMQISKAQFAAIDLNLYLDTHPCDQEALTLFKNIVSTHRSLVNDYEAQYGPLTAGSSSCNAPFDWVSPDQKWPWQK